MKKLFYLLVGILTISCSQKEINKSIINGTISDNIVDTLVFEVDNEKIPVPVNDSGIFRIEYSHKTSKYCTLVGSSKTTLFIKPESNINITISADTAEFSGDCKLECDFLQNREKHHKKVLKGFKDNEVFALAENEFVERLDSFAAALAHPLNELTLNSSVTQEFGENERERLKYWKYDMLSTYHRYSTTFTQETVLPSSGYFNFIDSAELNNTGLLVLDEYKEFLYSYILGKSFIKSVEDSLTNEQRTDLMLSMSEEQFDKQEMRDYVVLRVMKRLLYRLQLNDDVINKYKAKYAHLQDFDAILEAYENVKYLSKGNAAPDFTVTDAEGADVKLSDYKGKLVYVDIWSPFCPPCFHEFTFCHKVQEEFKGENIAFLSLCLDEDENRWKTNIEKYHLEGELLRAKEGWKSELMKQYAIQGVPRFLLIDDKGNIISANAPYPSDASLKTLINKYL